jgi:hypothetical protein
MYIEKLCARSKLIPGVLVETAGKKSAGWSSSQSGRPTIWLRCRSWRSDCVHKNGDIGLATILFPCLLGAMHVAVRPSGNDAQCSRAVSQHGGLHCNPKTLILPLSITSRRLSPLASMNKQVHVTTLQSLHDSSNSRDACTEQVRQMSLYLVCDAQMISLPLAGCGRATGWVST